MTFGAKCLLGCHGWCRNTKNTSCYYCKNRILFTITFSPTQNIKIYYLIPLKNSLFHTDIIIKHPTFGSYIVFTISVFAPNLRIRIRIRMRILTNVKKWYLYPSWRRIQVRISVDNPHLVAPLGGALRSGVLVSCPLPQSLRLFLRTLKWTEIVFFFWSICRNLSDWMSVPRS